MDNTKGNSLSLKLKEANRTILLQRKKNECMEGALKALKEEKNTLTKQVKDLEIELGRFKATNAVLKKNLQSAEAEQKATQQAVQPKKFIPPPPKFRPNPYSIDPRQIPSDFKRWWKGFYRPEAKEFWTRMQSESIWARMFPNVQPQHRRTFLKEAGDMERFRQLTQSQRDALTYLAEAHKDGLAFLEKEWGWD